MAGSTTTNGSNNNSNGGNNNSNNGNGSGSGSGGGKVCCNVKCAATTSVQWRSGWQLRSGGFANLCDDCGLKYEQMKFCESFHLKEDGWRACNICDKSIHCGCIASFYSFTLADNGGIECINCVKKSGSNAVASNAQHSNLLHFSKPLDLPAANLPDTFVPKLSQTANAKTWLPVSPLWQPVTGQPSASSLGRINEVDKSNFEQTLEKHSGEHSASTANKLEDGLSDRMKSKDLKLSILDSTCRNGSLGDTSEEINGLGSTRIDLLSGEFVKQADQLENPASACLNISLGSLVSRDDAPPSILGLAVPSVSSDEIKESKVLTTQTHRQRRQHLPKIAATSAATNTEAGKEIHPQVRVARPPGEGRPGRGTLLPRYWPRITDQELQQISGDSHSMITPLFEKVLSASDAGRIGRLVLPKACAEAYFPTISQPEGQPLKIQDAKGKEWVFQFRFWPNNNSRMYVLEGVTPCIQSMQLQAGDTVTFSRLETDGRLVMGFRKASNSANQEGQPSSAVNGNPPSGGLSNNNVETVPTLEGLSVLPARAVNGNSGTDIAPYAGQMNASDSSIGWYKNDTSNKLKDNSSCQHLAASDKRRNYTHGLKSKRLRIDNEDSLELKLTWEEAQDLLRPPPKAVPSIVMIEGHEFEEYEEPPVFGKRTIFTTNQAGEKNQWAQCDDCCSWRRLPVDAFLPPRWTCADNTWDPKRAFCSASQEVTSEELDKLIQLNTGSRKPEISEGQKAIEPSSGLDTLANVAALGENDNGPPLAAATTKHPRHRPGCSCIVCIQPPSGKGPKHKPTCTCNVCMTVKRRFKTLMMRRKKRQYEREAENAKKKRCWIKDEGEVNSGLNWQPEMCSPSENISRQDKSPLTLREGVGIVNSYPVDTVKVPSDINIPVSQKLAIVTERTSSGKGQIDLNSHPEREDEPPHGIGRVSMMKLLHDAGLPLEMYLKQQGLASLVPQSANTTNIGFEMHSNDQRIDEQSCPPNLQTQEEVQEEQFLTPNRVKSDGTSVSA